MKSEGFIFKYTSGFCVKSWHIIHTIPKNFKTATKKIFSPYSPIKLTWPTNITPHSKISKRFQEISKRSPKKNILTRIPYKTNLAHKFYAPLENFGTIPRNFKTASNKNILPRIPYKTNLAQKFYAALENFQTISKRPRKKYSSQNPI